MTFYKKHFKKIAAILGIIILGSVALNAQSLFSKQNSEYEQYTVKNEIVEQNIEVSGELKPKMLAGIGFQKSGQVKEIKVEVGTRVNKGDVLAIIENNDEISGLAQAKAGLAEANASLKVQLASATAQDIEISKATIAEAQASVDKAEVEVQNAKIELKNTEKTGEQQIKIAELEVNEKELLVEKATISADSTLSQNSADVQNAITSLKNAIGQVISTSDNNIQTVDKLFGLYGPTEYVKSSDFSGVSATLYDSIFNLLVDLAPQNESLEDKLTGLSTESTIEEVQSIASETVLFVKENRNILFGTSNLVNYITSDSDFTETELGAFKSELTTVTNTFDTAAKSFDTAKKSFDTAVISDSSGAGTLPLDLQSAKLDLEAAKYNLEQTKLEAEVKISNAENKVKSLEAQYQTAQASLQKAKASYQKTVAPARDVDVEPYRARVSQQAAQVQKAQATLDKTVLLAPTSGIITQKNIEIGEQVTSGVAASSPAFILMDDNDYHIDIDVPETEIISLSEDGNVEITFDALGRDKVFEGKISFIEPNATFIDNIVYYKVRIGMDSEDKMLKPGMTANITIRVKKEKETPVIPEKALIIIDGKKGVYIPDANGKASQKVIKTGIRGNNGLIEVIEGLTSGDIVLISNVTP